MAEFVARCPHGHTTALDNGQWRWCPHCPLDTQRAEPVMCDVCGNPFSPAQWELRHRPHADACALCETHFGVCSCPPLDTHDRCCKGCANHQESLL